jgi:hypothetical protein
MQREVDVVDHEIEHDGHIESARVEGGEPVGFDEAGAVQVVLRRPEGGVEALHMADLDHFAGRIPGRHEDLGLGERCGDRFLDEDVAASRQGHFRHASVVGGGRHDGHGVHGGEQRLRRIESLRHRSPTFLLG